MWEMNSKPSHKRRDLAVDLQFLTVDLLHVCVLAEATGTHSKPHFSEFRKVTLDYMFGFSFPGLCACHMPY